MNYNIYEYNKNIIDKLVSDVKNIFSWVSNKYENTDQIKNIFIYIVKEKIDVVFLMPERYYRKSGNVMVKNMSDRLFNEYKDTYIFFRMIYFSEFIPSDDFYKKL